MPSSDLKFNILNVARDLLFVEDTDFYPAEIWEEFREALYLFLTDNEIEVLNYRYGDVDFCSFSVENRRRILSDLVLRFNRSEFYSEMDATMKAHESAIFAINDQNPFVQNRADSEELVLKALANIGLSHLPGSVGECNFDSQIGNFPVYVWRSSEVQMPLRILKDMLNAVAAAGFGRFFVVAPPRLTSELPINAPGFIPYTFIPLLEETPDPGKFDTGDQPFTM